MPRFALSLVAGSTITVFLYFFLYTLISAGGLVTGYEAPAKIDFQRLKIAEDLELKKRFKPEREKPEPPPPTEGIVQPQDEVANVIAPFDIAPSSSLLAGAAGLGSLVVGRAAGDFSLTGATSADQGIMPLVRINPEYPESAKMRGIEGYVYVELTISTSGSVRNPRVIKYEPSSVFNRAALQAVRRWKYSPQVENGQPTEKTIRVKLVFELEKDKG